MIVPGKYLIGFAFFNSFSKGWFLEKKHLDYYVLCYNYSFWIDDILTTNDMTKSVYHICG